MPFPLISLQGRARRNAERAARVLRREREQSLEAQAAVAAASARVAIRNVRPTATADRR